MRTVAEMLLDSRAGTRLADLRRRMHDMLRSAVGDPERAALAIAFVGGLWVKCSIASSPRREKRSDAAASCLMRLVDSMDVTSQS